MAPDNALSLNTLREAGTSSGLPTSLRIARRDSLFAHFLRGFVYGFFGGLLDLTNRLIQLAVVAQLVVAGQRTRRLFDAALRYVCFATHVTDSFQSV